MNFNEWITRSGEFEICPQQSIRISNPKQALCAL